METLGGEKGRNEKECGSVQLRIMKLRVMWELRVVYGLVPIGAGGWISLYLCCLAKDCPPRKISGTSTSWHTRAQQDQSSDPTHRCWMNENHPRLVSRV